MKYLKTITLHKQDRSYHDFKHEIQTTYNCKETLMQKCYFYYIFHRHFKNCNLNDIWHDTFRSSIQKKRLISGMLGGSTRANVRHSDMEFKARDNVFTKVAPMK